jgi:hypothetical protein
VMVARSSVKVSDGGKEVRQGDGDTASTVGGGQRERRMREQPHVTQWMEPHVSRRKITGRSRIQVNTRRSYIEVDLEVCCLLRPYHEQPSAGSRQRSADECYGRCKPADVACMATRYWSQRHVHEPVNRRLPLSRGARHRSCACNAIVG